jgi:hypothetical protein
LAGKSCKFYVSFFDNRQILCCIVLESVQPILVFGYCFQLPVNASEKNI